MDASDKNTRFSWGKRVGESGAENDVQLYESFEVDNVTYSLYDCVCLFNPGDPKPYIGKIVNIWKENESGKVEILWFFHPSEIKKYLEGTVMEKEVFLACGDGPGLADINPVEAIASKCTVICISKDERNRQPSHQEEEMADYIFYRFFDVEKCTLSDLVPDEIAGLKVDVLLNPKLEQVTSSSGEANMEGVAATTLLPQSVVKNDVEKFQYYKRKKEVTTSPGEANMEAVAGTTPLPQSIDRGENVFQYYRRKRKVTTKSG